MLTTAFFFIDPMYLILVLLPSLALAGLAQWRVKSAYAKGSKINARSGLTGRQVAEELLQNAGLNDVRIERVQGFLSDHYDPSKRVLRLSPDNHDGRSLAALGVAAHEAGHALQHAQGYAPLVVRNSIVPVAGFGSQLSTFLIIGGLLLNFMMQAQWGIGLAWIGVLLFSAVVVFQLVNLPVEFNASSRAREHLLALGIVSEYEDGTVKQVLNAAAMTYVAATVTAILNLLYLVMLVSSAGRE